jgi:S-adenosylmethionine:tRNA-ribosyltransferase-isomerase (queuine synthetase)
MARLKTAAELEQERLETLQKLTGNYPIEKYTKRPALVYSRYSTARQVRDSIAAGLQQSEKLLQRADDLGWERSLLTLLVENQMTGMGGYGQLVERYRLKTEQVCRL